MKKLLFIFIIFSYIDTSAQLHDFFLSAGVSGSNSLTKRSYFFSPSGLGFETPSYLFGKTIGGGLSYALPKKEGIFIQTDFNYVERGLKIKTSLYTIPGSSSKVRRFYTMQYNYIDATVLLKQYNSFKKFKFGYGLGVTFGGFKDSKVKSNMGYNSNGQLEVKPKNASDYTEEEEGINFNNKGFDFAISGEFSLDYSMNSKASLGFNLRFNRSLFYSSKKISHYQSALQRYDTPKIQEVGIKSRNLLLTVVYKYRIPEKPAKAN